MVGTKATKTNKPKKKKTKVKWKNRIVDQALLDPKELNPNALNPVKHPAFQKQLMGEALDKIGWIQDIIVNKTTGNMIDGHLRLELSLKHGESEVPVKYVELTEAEEKVALLTFDPIGEYARQDQKSIAELLKQTQSEPVGSAISTMLEEIGAEADLVIEEVSSRGTTILDIQEDTTDTRKVKASSVTGNKSKDRDDEGFRIFDGRIDAADVGTGPCLHKCLYCFTKASRASISWKGMRPKVLGEMTKAVERAARRTRLLEVGSANDPSMPQFVEPLKETLRAVMKNKVFLLIQTKNPGYFIPILEAMKFPPGKICFRVSFSSNDDGISSKMEPGTELPSQRVDSMKVLSEAGYETVFRLSPLILDHYDGIEENAAELKGFATQMVVEPLRCSRTAHNVFHEIERVIDPDWTIAKYFDKWGLRGSKATYGAAGWYAYDPYLLREEYKKMKAIAHENDMEFALENFPNAYPSCDLNDGDHPADSPHVRKFGVEMGDLLTTFVKNGRIKELRCDYLRDCESDSEFERRKQMVELANYHDLPLLIEQGVE